MEILRDQLYDYVSQVAFGDYNIGMHGIMGIKLPDGVTVDMAAQGIMEKGIRNVRPINGTVKFFGRMDLVQDEQKVRAGLSQYNYGGVELMLVAIPTVIRSESGKTLFLGSPNLNNSFRKTNYTAGYEETCLLDRTIQDPNIENGVYKGDLIAPEFILGGCKVIDDETFDVTLNPNHICFNNGLVSDDAFERIKERFKKETVQLGKTAELFEKISLTPEDKDAINSSMDSVKMLDDVFESDSSALLESLAQLRDEDTKAKRTINKVDVPIDFCEISDKTNQK